jgi:hypothetical protein
MLALSPAEFKGGAVIFSPFPQENQLIRLHPPWLAAFA